jgi:hypothetical protein
MPTHKVIWRHFPQWSHMTSLFSVRSFDVILLYEFIWRQSLGVNFCYVTLQHDVMEHYCPVWEGVNCLQSTAWYPVTSFAGCLGLFLYDVTLNTMSPDVALRWYHILLSYITYYHILYGILVIFFIFSYMYFFVVKRSRLLSQFSVFCIRIRPNICSNL